MKIGIDARLLEETGVGRYISNLISELSRLDTKNEYVVFLRNKSMAKFLLPGKNWKKVEAEVRWHTLAEQLVMPRIFDAQKLDILHVPYHNPPAFYRGPLVVTIHDLTILHFATGKATKLPMVLYQLKRLGYVLELVMGLRNARHIITVSQATKRELMDHFRVSPDRISVTYEGVDAHLTKKGSQSANDSAIIGPPYFLYVGNAYPHKNLERLISGFEAFVDESLVVQNGTYGSGMKLVLVGSDDYFYGRLKEAAMKTGVSDRLVFYGAANDTDLLNLYTHATAFVFPSLMEGFGLPAIEALSLGCPVLVSDISVFHEILGSNATYFDPNDVSAIARVLKHAAENGPKRMIKPGHDDILTQYSWKKLARETLTIYERCARI